MENNNFFPHNLIYVKVFHLPYLTARLNTLACIYDTLYENLISHQLMHVRFNILFNEKLIIIENKKKCKQNYYLEYTNYK